MEQAKLIKKRPNFYVCLGLCLLLTFVGITLLLAKGLDSNRFFGNVTWMLAGLPIALTIPFYIGFDFFEHTYHAEDPISFCPIAPKGAENTRKFAFLLAIVAALITIVLFFVYNENAEVNPVKASLIYLIPTLPPLLLYVAPMVPLCFKEKKEGDGTALVIILTVAIAGAGVLVYGLLDEQPTFLLTYIVYPLCACALMLYKRED